MHQSNQTYLLVEITIINVVEMLCCWKREIWPMCLINSCSSGHSSNHLSFASNLTLWTSYLAQTVKMWWEGFGQWNTPVRWSMTNLDLDSDGNWTVGHMFYRQVLYHYAYQLPVITPGAPIYAGILLGLPVLPLCRHTHISGISLWAWPPT